MSYDSTRDTLDHIDKVQHCLDEIRAQLVLRGVRHDASKLREPEKSGYDRLTIALKDCAYGSDAYRAALSEARPTIEHHYAANDHHPEHWPNGVHDMSFLSITEMLCDWAAAADRHGGLTLASLENNRRRFGISDQLYTIIVHTYHELGWINDESMERHPGEHGTGA